MVVNIVGRRREKGCFFINFTSDLFQKILTVMSHLSNGLFIFNKFRPLLLVYSKTVNTRNVR